MRKFIVCRVIVLAIAGVALMSCNTAKNNYLLWEISGNGLSESSYIFGTHHIAPLTICDSIVGFDDAFNSCKQLYGEIDMLNLSADESKISAAMMLPKDSLLDVLYSPEEYKLIDSIFKIHMGVGVDRFNIISPAALGLQLSLVQHMKMFKGFDPSKALDKTLQSRAAERGAAVYGLETVDFQMNLLFGRPLAEQVDDLLKMVSTIDSAEERIKGMNESYMAQDLDNMFEYFRDPVIGVDSDEEFDRLINDRNHNWMGQIKSIFETPTFIVVGAGHLPGDEGLLSLLRKQGYTVKGVE